MSDESIGLVVAEILKDLDGMDPGERRFARGWSLNGCDPERDTAITAAMKARGYVVEKTRDSTWRLLTLLPTGHAPDATEG